MLTDEQIESSWNEGKAMTLDEAVQYARAEKD
jgi:hypothetical protein